MRVALEQGASDEMFMKTLVKIRDNISFHYKQPKKLVEGYRRHFFESKLHAANAHAYVSLGNTMGHTRFFFADAAVSGSLTLFQDKQFLNRIVKVSDAANLAIRFLMEEHIRPARRPD